MKQVISNLIALSCAFGVFFLITLILSEDVAMPPWIPFELRKDTWLAPLLRVFGILLLAPPMAALIGSLTVLGTDPYRRSRARATGTGELELTLKPGPKYTAIGLCLLFLGGIVFALIWQEEPLGIWLFVSPMILATLYGLVLCFVVRARFDDTGISAIYYGLRWQHRDWRDLTALELQNGAGDMVLRFGDKGPLRVSVYYNGILDLVDHAKRELRTNLDA